jgi:flap endonuclease-1
MVSCYRTMRERLLGTPGIISSWDCEMLSCVDSHLMGFFYRTIRMVENGIKPAYVFDGKPPELKSGVVCVITYNARRSLVNSSETLVIQASRTKRGSKRSRRGSERNWQVTIMWSRWGADPWIGTAEDLDKFSRRTVKVTREHNEECRKLLGLMGIPVIVVRRSFLSHFVVITPV